ncbi:MAG: S-methyl-5'-thioadenosine phosphorylase [Anaerolineaceae bacterium]|nr:S-methyl-5'-thioadenosine phosphorylase [Anaerolineaceae bacterium]
MNAKPVLGVIGGSGLYDFPSLDKTSTYNPQTPFGYPSAPVVIGELNGKPVAFLARHGIGHTISPTEVNSRANIYALKMLGVERIISISACGSLREDFAPGNIVIPDQLFDHTHLRPRSFFSDGLVVHVGSADPFCAELSTLLHQAVSAAAGISVHKGGAMITIEGPRFSTKAESNIYRMWGLSLIGMTTCPEAFLAREAEMCYSVMAHVTDYDVWHLTEEGVSVEMVMKTLMKNTEVAQRSITTLVNSLPEKSECSCNHALENAIITNRASINSETAQKLNLLIEKYVK